METTTGTVIINCTFSSSRRRSARHPTATAQLAFKRTSESSADCDNKKSEGKKDSENLPFVHSDCIDSFYLFSSSRNQPQHFTRKFLIHAFLFSSHNAHLWLPFAGEKFSPWRKEPGISGSGELWTFDSRGLVFTAFILVSPGNCFPFLSLLFGGSSSPKRIRLSVARMRARRIKQLREQ